MMGSVTVPAMCNGQPSALLPVNDVHWDACPKPGAMSWMSRNACRGTAEQTPFWHLC